MNTVIRLIIILLFAVIGNFPFLSCSKEERGNSSTYSLEIALQHAGENRAEFEKVLSHYKSNNIEWTFKVKKEQPWGGNISFVDFCEYILPYRIGVDTLSYWREDIYQNYNPLLDLLRTSVPYATPLKLK